jgi:hypothetical protein
MTNRLGWLRLIVRQRIRQGLRARIADAWQQAQEEFAESEEFEEEDYSPRQRRSRPGQGRQRRMEQRTERTQRANRREAGDEAAQATEARTRPGTRQERESAREPAQETTQAPAKSRKEILYEVFEAMKGQSKEFLDDGRPRMEHVNRRLERHGADASNREEVDAAFEAWQRAN